MASEPRPGSTRQSISVGGNAAGVAQVAGDTNTVTVTGTITSGTPPEVVAALAAIQAALAGNAATKALADAAGRAAVAAAFARLRADAAAGRFDVAADRAFHEAIAAATVNAMLERLVAELWRVQTAPLAARLSSLAVSTERRRYNLGEHAAIADAIAAGDTVAAKAAMRRHLLAVHRARLATLRAGGGEGGS